jgi:tight adherence protein B
MIADLLLAIAVSLLAYTGMQSRNGLPALRSAWDDRVIPLCESLGGDLPADRWFAWTVLAGLGVLAAGTFLLGLLAGILFAVGTAALPIVLLQVRVKQRLDRIDRQLPAALDAMASVLRAGQSLPQAVAWVAKEGPAPIKNEFAELSREMALGASLEEGMARMAARIPSRGLRSFSMTLEPLRAMGANLIPALQGMADVLRRRQSTVEKLATLAAQAKLQLWVMSLLLPALSAVMFVLEPRLMARLFTDSLGNVLLALALTLQATGMLLAKRFLDPKKLWN